MARLTLCLGLLLVAAVAFANAADSTVFIAPGSGFVWNGDCDNTACSSAQPCSFPSAPVTASGSASTCKLSLASGQYSSTQINAQNRKFEIALTGHILALTANVNGASALSFTSETSSVVEDSVLSVKLSGSAPAGASQQSIVIGQVKFLNSFIKAHIAADATTPLTINFTQSQATYTVVPPSNINPFPSLFTVTAANTQNPASSVVLNILGSTIALHNSNRIGVLQSVVPVSNVTLDQGSSIAYPSFIAFVTPSRATTVSLTSGSSLQFVKNIFFGPVPFPFKAGDGNLLLTRAIEGNTQPIEITGFTYRPSKNAHKAALADGAAVCVGLSLTNTRLTNLDIACGFSSAYNCPFFLKDSVVVNSNLCLLGPDERYASQPRLYAPPQLENTIIQSNSFSNDVTFDNVDVLVKDLTVRNQTGFWNYDHPTGGSLVIQRNVTFLPQSTNLITNALYLTRYSNLVLPGLTFSVGGSFYLEEGSSLAPGPSVGDDQVWTFKGDTVFQRIALNGGSTGPAPIVQLSGPSRILVSPGVRLGNAQIAAGSTISGPNLIIDDAQKWFKNAQIDWDNFVTGGTPRVGSLYVLIHKAIVKSANTGPFPLSITGASSSMRGFNLAGDITIALSNK